jgi:hypothetical protein
MFFGIILVLILLFFCVVLALTFAHITEAVLPYRYNSYQQLPKAEQWLLKGLVYYPLLVALLLTTIMFTDMPAGGDNYVTWFSAGHGIMSAIGAAVALKLKHKGYRLWYWMDILLGGAFFLFAAAAVFKFD